MGLHKVQALALCFLAIAIGVAVARSHYSREQKEGRSWMQKTVKSLSQQMHPALRDRLNRIHSHAPVLRAEPEDTEEDSNTSSGSSESHGSDEEIMAYNITWLKENDQVVAIAKNMRFSDVFNGPDTAKYINKELNYLYLFGFATMDVDMNVTATSITGGSTFNLVLAAQNLMLEKPRGIINLSGTDGEDASESDSIHGKPGTPGKPGGSFVGLVFIPYVKQQESYLQVITNGGKGGNGGDGKPGQPGQPGESPKRENLKLFTKNDCTQNEDLDVDINFQPMKFNLTQHFNKSCPWGFKFLDVYDCINYTVHGQFGSEGTAGGNGGDGGAGGKAGKAYYKVIKPGISLRFCKEGEDGRDGTPGQPGEGGLQGEHGQDCDFGARQYRIINGTNFILRSTGADEDPMKDYRTVEYHCVTSITHYHCHPKDQPREKAPSGEPGQLLPARQPADLDDVKGIDKSLLRESKKLLPHRNVFHLPHLLMSLKEKPEYTVPVCPSTLRSSAPSRFASSSSSSSESSSSSQSSSTEENQGNSSSSSESTSEENGSSGSSSSSSEENQGNSSSSSESNSAESGSSSGSKSSSSSSSESFEKKEVQGFLELMERNPPQSWDRQRLGEGAACGFYRESLNVGVVVDAKRGVRLSEALQCIQPNSSIVMVYSTEHIIIDEDLNAAELNGGQAFSLAITAPGVRVEGRRTINLNGVDGRDDFTRAPDGQPGQPGEDGQDAGHLLILTDKFYGPNGDLHVKLDGGKGGRGQDGGHGGVGGRPSKDDFDIVIKKRFPCSGKFGLNATNVVKSKKNQVTADLGCLWGFEFLRIHHCGTYIVKGAGRHGQPGGRGGRGGSRGTAQLFVKNNEVLPTLERKEALWHPEPAHHGQRGEVGKSGEPVEGGGVDVQITASLKKYIRGTNTVLKSPSEGESGEGADSRILPLDCRVEITRKIPIPAPQSNLRSIAGWLNRRPNLKSPARLPFINLNVLVPVISNAVQQDPELEKLIQDIQSNKYEKVQPDPVGPSHALRSISAIKYKQG